jgi:maltodextrin utilization protein YvdJ
MKRIIIITTSIFVFFLIEYKHINCIIQVVNNPVEVQGKITDFTNLASGFSRTSVITYYDKKGIKYTFHKISLSKTWSSAKVGDIVNITYSEQKPSYSFSSIYQEIGIIFFILLMVLTCFQMFLYALVALISRELGLKRGDDGADNLF